MASDGCIEVRDSEKNAQETRFFYGWLYDTSTFVGTFTVKDSEKYLHTFNSKYIEEPTSIEKKGVSLGLFLIFGFCLISHWLLDFN